MFAKLRLLQHQKPMLKTIGKIIVGSLKKTSYDITVFEKASGVFTLTPPKSIVNQYHKWLNTTAKYQNTIAPHLYPQWAIPELYKLGETYGLPFHKVLNQGCKLKINAPLPKGTNLMGKVQLLDIKNHENKIRINQKIWTGPKDNPVAMEAEIYAVILKNNKKGFTAKKSNTVIDVSKYKKISSLFISRKDAKSYGLISGDVNPIHMSEKVAKLFGLKTSLMHGFGLYALIFEELERYGYKVYELEMKFLKPLYLNHHIHIFLEQKNENQFSLKVLSKDHKSLYLIGSLSTSVSPL